MSGTPDERGTDHPDAALPPGTAESGGVEVLPAALVRPAAPEPPDGDGLEADQESDRADQAADWADRESDRVGREADREVGGEPPDEPADEFAGGVGERVTVRLPRRRPAARRPVRRAPVLVAAGVATLLGAFAVWVPVVVVVLLATRLGGGGLGFGASLRAGLAVWLLAHGVPVHVAGVPLSLVPLAVTGFAGWRVIRAGVHTARATGARRRRGAGPAVAAAVSVAAVYAALGLLAGYLAREPGVEVDPAGAALRLGAFGLVLAGAGAVVESGALVRLRARTAPVLRDALRTGVVAALLVLGAGAGAAGMALAVNAGDASDILGVYHAGVAGQAGLTLVCLAYAPNLSIWSAAYLIGPGFAVGVGTTVSPASVTLGPIPPVPVLAGMPGASVSGPGVLLLGLPVVAGMVAGVLLVRRQLREAGGAPVGRGATVGAALLAGPVAGVLLGLAAYASSGGLGGERLSDLGPVAWQVALVGAGVVALGTLLGGAAARVLVSPAPAPAPPRRRPRPTRR